MNAFMRHGAVAIAAQFLVTACAAAQTGQSVQKEASAETADTIDCAQFGTTKLAVITVAITEDTATPQNRIKVFGCEGAVDPDLTSEGIVGPRFPNRNVTRAISLDSIGVSTFERREGSSHVCVDINRGGGTVYRICPRH